jgi:hypothetical protein
VIWRLESQNVIIQGHIQTLVYSSLAPLKIMILIFNALCLSCQLGLVVEKIAFQNLKFGIGMIPPESECSLQCHQHPGVKVHKDNKKSYEKLNIWGHLNCNANSLPEKFLKLVDFREVNTMKEVFFMDLIGSQNQGQWGQGYFAHT